MRKIHGFIRNLVGLVLVASAVTFAGGNSEIPPQAQSPSATAVEIILPSRIVAGQSATLATIGANRKLVAHVTIDLGNGKHMQTDATGRATFTAPAGNVLVARAGAVSAATLIDPASAAVAQPDIRVGPFASLRGEFSICGGGFHGDAEGDQIQIGEQPALILAASPECVVVVPSPKTPTGREKVVAQTDAARRTAATTIVSLDFEPPQPSLVPGRKGWLTLRARGSEQRLHILIENEAPDALRFEKGDTQDVTTSGGGDNRAEIRVQALRSGDFGFHARVLPPADPEAATKFLEAAESLAIADVPHTLKTMESELRHRPPNSDKIRAQIDQMLQVTSPTDFRTLLEAARSAL